MTTVDEQLAEQERAERERKAEAQWQIDKATAEANLLRASDAHRERRRDSIRFVQPKPQPYRPLSEQAKQAILEHAERFRDTGPAPSALDDIDAYRRHRAFRWDPAGRVVRRQVDEAPPAERPEHLRQTFGEMSHYYVAANGRYAGPRTGLPDHVDMSFGYVQIVVPWQSIDLEKVLWSPNQRTLYGDEAVAALAAEGKV